MTRLEPAGRDPATGDLRWILHVPPLEAGLLTGLPDRLSELLTHPERNGAIIDRLFPHSYGDAAQERELRRLLGESLFDARRQLVADVRALLMSAPAADGSLRLCLLGREADLLLRFLNDTRLVLATELNVTTNLGDIRVDWCHPDAPKYALLEYLAGVELLLLHALGGD